MTKRGRIAAFVSVVLLVAVITWMQPRLNKMQEPFVEKRPKATHGGQFTNMLIDQSIQFFGAAALGLRQAVAGLLWIRTDEFFHRGEFETIIPLSRLVTWLDPQQIDVYSTASWHLDFNFVDSDQRSDKRLIPPAIKLMEEGIRNNPDIYDLYFDLAWTHYYWKAKDYEKALEWLKKAVQHDGRDPNTGKRIPRPGFVDRMLAHTYEKVGLFDEAEKQWRKNLAESLKRLKADPKDGSRWQEVGTCRRNLAMLCLRRAWRYGDMDAYKRGLDVLDDLVRTEPNISEKDPEQVRAYKAAKKAYEQLVATGKRPHDVSPPIDVGFSVKWRKIKPKVITIEGTLKLVPIEEYKGLAAEPYTNFWKSYEFLLPSKRPKWVDNSRVRIIFADADYNFREIKTPKKLSWEVDKTRTVLWDDTPVESGKFKIKIDMSRDPSFYPFAKEDYKLIVWFDPQEAPITVQDRIGWKGEGITDKNYLSTTFHPGYRVVVREFKLKRSDIM